MFGIQMKPLILAIIISLVSATMISAQTTHHHGVFWGRFVISDKITDRLKWDLFLQKRTQNVPGEKSIFGAPHFTSVWLWLNYTLSKSWKVSVSPFGYFTSYAFLTEPADTDIPGIKEYRWVVRFEEEQKYKWFNFSNRYSFEYRRRDLERDNRYQPNWRIRYQARAEKPVTGILPNKMPVTFFVADEIFIQFGKAVRENPNVFDQNRLSAGFSLQVVKNIKTSFSYLNIMQERNNGKDFDNAHSLWVILAIDNVFSQFKRHPANKQQ